MYFVKQGRNNYNELQWNNVRMGYSGLESNPVIIRVGAFAEYVSEDYPVLQLDNHTEYRDT